MVRHPQPPRPPRMDDIAAKAAMGGMPMKQGPVPFHDVTPSFQWGPMKPREGQEHGPLYLIGTPTGSIYAPTFAIMRPYGYILFSHDEGLRPFKKSEITIGEHAVSCREDQTDLIWNEPTFWIVIKPHEEWMLITKKDSEALEAYITERLEGGKSVSLSEFLKTRQSSDQSAGTDSGAEES